jgi:uncharacterized protein
MRLHNVRINFMVNLSIEIVFASCQDQIVIPISVHPECTVHQAIVLSGILKHFPEIDLSQQRVGVFGRFVQLNDHVCAGDRIEIYRPLKIDPKQARRKRAQN